MEISEDSTFRILSLISLALILFSGTLVFSPGTTKAASNGVLGMVIPLYTYPTDGSWKSVIDAKNANPQVPIMAVVNPSNGPGSSQDQNYVKGIQQLQSAGVKVLGYVYTNYGSRSLASDEADVVSYNRWYGVNGIMFDEMNNQKGDEGYYSALNTFVHSSGMSTTLGNPGTSVPTSYIGTMDVICVYEGSGYPSLSFISYPGYNPGNFCVLPYGVPLDTTFISEASSLVSWVYATDDGGTNPYNSLPSYFASEIATIGTIDATTGSTTGPKSYSVTVRSLTLSGTLFTGMWTTWSSNGVVLSSGFTPLSFSGWDGGKYTATVSNYLNYKFCHWQNGNTSPSRTLTLSGDVVLNAYYSTNGSCSNSSGHKARVLSGYLEGPWLT